MKKVMVGQLPSHIPFLPKIVITHASGSTVNTVKHEILDSSLLKHVCNNMKNRKYLFLVMLAT